jgi:hypothetical protein
MAISGSHAVEPLSASRLTGANAFAGLITAKSGQAAQALSAANFSAEPGLLDPAESGSQADPDEVRRQFDQFVGGTFYRQLLGELQKTVGKPAYMHGGQAEDMFRAELNSRLADQLAATTAAQFTGPLFELFMLQRS